MYVFQQRLVGILEYQIMPFVMVQASKVALKSVIPARPVTTSTVTVLLHARTRYGRQGGPAVNVGLLMSCRTKFVLYYMYLNLQIPAHTVGYNTKLIIV